MVRDFHREAYDRMLQASRESNSADIDGVFWHAAVLIAKDLKAMHGRSRNMELMLLKLIRAIRRRDQKPAIGRDEWESRLDEVADKAADLYARLVGTDGTLR
jgi:hypothetical protein